MKKFLLVVCFLLLTSTTLKAFETGTIHWSFEKWEWKLSAEEIDIVSKQSYHGKLLSEIPKGTFLFESQLNYDSQGNLVINDSELKKFLSDKEIISNSAYPELDGRLDMQIDKKAKIINKIEIYFDSARFVRVANRSFDIPTECSIFNEYNKPNANRIKNGKNRLILGKADWWGRAMLAIKICDKDLWLKINEDN